MIVSLTGGTGFVGRYLINHLSDAGHQVRAWCRCPTNAPHLDPRVCWIQGQLGDQAASDELVSGADAIVHTAVHRESGNFLQDPSDPIDYYERNVIGSLRLLQSAEDHDGTRFVFVSSGAVHDRVLENRPLDETHPLWPKSLYGASKAAVETLVHQYGLSGKLDACSLRPTAIYGIADPIEHSKWFDLIRSIVGGHDVSVSGGSKSVHASDVAKAALLLLETDCKVAGETYNCCDRMISEDEVAEIACRITGSPSRRLGIRKVAKSEIETGKLRSLGMTFGDTPLLEETVRQLVDAAKKR